MIEGDAIPEPFTQSAGDPERGSVIFVERDKGHCVLCHRIEGLDAPFQGNLGPSLTGVGARLGPGQLRLRIADPSKIWPNTIMPAYYRVTGLNQVDPAYAHKPIIAKQDIEDLIAYLVSQIGAPETED